MATLLFAAFSSVTRNLRITNLAGMGNHLAGPHLGWGFLLSFSRQIYPFPANLRLNEFEISSVSVQDRWGLTQMTMCTSAFSMTAPIALGAVE